jgi:Domain of Unknown Function (DUF1080)
MFRRSWTLLGVLALAGLTTQICLNDIHAQNKTKEVYTDPSDPSLPPEFKIQGEYVGKSGSEKLGCQIIALGNGALQAVILPGGLPGDGWDGKNKILMQGEVTAAGAKFEPATGKRNYLAGNPMQFSATSKFPPVGQADWSGAVDAEGVLSGKTDTGDVFHLNKITRMSDRLGAKVPSGGITLYDGTDTNEWKGGRIDAKTGFLNTDGHDIPTVRKFMNYTAHVEFMLPFRPTARGQGRGNSGFYQVLHYEVQILDSFGLDGKDNECGGIYTKLAPKVNMCYPPLTWQSYDVDFTNAVREGDKKVKNARITLRHNGVIVHEDAEIKGPTGGHRNDPEGTPGPLLLQGHGNPLQFKNIWVVEKS